ncbi:NAD(P)-binding protein [Xylariomycetidae sp. FL0641]|nr:NAD(P)-binding protein [Xylariomycetidae sp. FL0641]
MKKFVVLISGVTRGIGKGFVEHYLKRPDHIVVGTIRDSPTTPANVEELRSFPKAAGTELLLVKIESASPTDPAKAVQELRDQGIEHLDLVIANAGGTPVPAPPLESVTYDDMIRDYHVNAIGPFMLFQACRPLLQKAESPKWISVSTGGASKGLMGKIHSWDGTSYASAKAALNWITRAIHFTSEWLVAIALNPGLVATEQGTWCAHYWGLPKADYTIEESVTSMMKTIDEATREKSSGKFMRLNGDELPW